MINSALKRKFFTVSEVNYYLKSLIQNDILLSDIYIKGELSNYKKHSSGHMYFTLKDDESKIRVIMFKSNASKLKFNLEDGMSIIARGYFSLYEKDGQYQLYANEILLDGIGELYKAYEQLKLKLENEGVFHISKKKPLPFLPLTIGIVTSSTGAAIRDIISIIKRRFNSTNILLYPVQVQGDKAPFEITEAIRFLNHNNLVDLIIIGRGGGSIEELWAFNEEQVARAISDSKIPIISAVGHETDFTISDFAADVRAATPSSAAELAVPDKIELAKQVDQMRYRLNSSIIRIIQSKKIYIQAISRHDVFNNIEKKILSYSQNVDILDRYLQINMENILNNNKSIIENHISKLDLLNPAASLLRGYALVMNKEKNSKLITSINHLKKDDIINIKFKDGSVEATILNIKEGM